MAHWTKGATFAVLDTDPALYGPLPQLTAATVFLKKEPFGLFFATQWEYFVMDDDAVADRTEGDFPHQPGFIDNRHDQAIFSLLAYKYELQVGGWVV